RQAEAERSRRAKIINAQGEQQAAQKLVEAAHILAPVPQAMQLRYLATLFDIASERRHRVSVSDRLDGSGAALTAMNKRRVRSQIPPRCDPPHRGGATIAS